MECGERRFGGVCGETDVPHLALGLGLQDHLQNSARAERLVDLILALEAVELIEIEMAGVESFQRTLELEPAFLGVVLLGSEEIPSLSPSHM
jgi:hypothetical protein